MSAPPSLGIGTRIGTGTVYIGTDTGTGGNSEGVVMKGIKTKSALRGISAGREWGIPPGRDFATQKT